MLIEIGTRNNHPEFNQPDGVRVSVAVWIPEPYVAVIVTGVAVPTAFVVAVKVVLVEPAGTVTEEGTATSEGLPLDKVICAPPLGAGPANCTVP